MRCRLRDKFLGRIVDNKPAACSCQTKLGPPLNTQAGSSNQTQIVGLCFYRIPSRRFAHEKYDRAFGSNIRPFNLARRIRTVALYLNSGPSLLRRSMIPQFVNKSEGGPLDHKTWSVVRVHPFIAKHGYPRTRSQKAKKAGSRWQRTTRRRHVDPKRQQF